MINTFLVCLGFFSGMIYGIFAIIRGDIKIDVVRDDGTRFTTCRKLSPIPISDKE
jgi:hypothetical protein